MVESSLLDSIGVVSLSMAVPLLAVGVQRWGGSTFGSMLGLLGVVGALGVATVLAATGFTDLASVFVVAAAIAFLAAGWQLSVDGVRQDAQVYVPGADRANRRGFEE